MTMEVSRLGIEVTSTGIREATNALIGSNGNGGLYNAADRVEKRVTSMTASLQRLSGLNVGATMQMWSAAMGGTTSAVASLVAQLNQLTAGMGGVVNAANRLTQANNQAAGSAREYTTHSGVMLNTLKAMTSAALAYASVNFGMSIVKQADEWQMMTARLQNATGSLNNAHAAQQQMFDLSQRLRVPLEEQVKLYTRMAPAMQRLGKTSDDTRNVVEGVATALQLGGANGAEMSSVMLQLSQSFGSGVLNGQEFNAVAENGQVIMKALMDFTGKNQSQLKKMGSEGKLAIGTVNDAIQAALPKWREQFDNLPVTFEGGVQRIKNAWTKAVGEMGQDTHFNSELSKSLRTIENMIPAVAQGMGNAFIEVMKWVQENKNILEQIGTQVVGLAKDVIGIVGSFIALAGAIAGAGDEISVFGLVVFGIRMGIAAIVDIVHEVGASFLHVGLDIIEVVATPLRNIVELLGTILGGVGKFQQALADMARTAGMTSLADQLDKVAQGSRTSAYSLLESSSQYDEFITKGRALADSWEEGLNNGKSAVDEVMNGATAADAKIKAMLTMNAKDWNANKNPKAPEDAKAAKAAADLQKHFEDMLASAKAMLDEVTVTNSRISEMGLAYDKVGPAQKKVLEMQEKIKELQDSSVKSPLNARQIADDKIVLAIYQQAAAEELVNEKLKDRLTYSEKITKSLEEQTKAIQSAALKQEDKNSHPDGQKGDSDWDVLARFQADLTAAQETQKQMIPGTLAEVDAQNSLVKALQERADAQERLAKADDIRDQKKGLDDLDKLLDPKKAKDFGDAFTSAFGQMGKGLSQVVKTMEMYQDRTKKVGEAWKIVKALQPGKEQEAATKQAIAYETQMRLESYADMSEAAKSFFKDGTVGYTIMGDAEKAFRAMELALAVENFAVKNGIITAETAATVEGYAMAAVAAVKSTAIQIAQALGLGPVLAALGIATQAQGDPYSAWGRMAAMAAAMAALGFAVSGMGGGSGPSAKDRQEAQGTGTVLGDASKKSESIAKSIDALKDTSDIALGVSQGMLASLKNIESALTGVTNAIALGGNSITGKGFDGSKFSVKDMLGLGSIKDILSLNISGVFGSMVKALGFGTSKSLLDSGITSGNQSVGDVLNGGFQGSAYQDVKSTHHVFGFSTGSNYSRDTQALDPAIASSFTQVIQGMVNTVTQAATALGMNATQVQAEIAKVQVSLGDISLKDLSSEEIQKQLEAVFSAFGDTITTTVLGPTITKFQQAGEGLLQTAVRVASGVDQAGYELEKLGLTAINFSDIINTSGDVGAEIVRQSIEMKEAGTGIGAIVETLQGTAGDIAKTYSDLVKARASLKQLGIAGDVSVDLIRAAGGLDALQSALDDYQKNFFSQSEQNAMSLDSLRTSFAALGQTMPTTRQGFRDLVTQLSASGAAGQDLAAKVILLSGAFGDIADQYDSQVSDAKDALRSAYDDQSSALSDTITKFKDFTKSLGEFKDSLLTGDLSTLSASEKYQQELAQYQDVVARAKAGDQDALAQYQDVANALLQSSRDVNASGAAYSADFQKVLDDTQALQNSTSGQVSVAQQQLDALNAQVDGLITLNTSVLTVQQAIDNLTALMAAGINGTGTSTQVDGSHASGLANVPFNGYIAELHKDERVLTASQNKEYMDYSQYRGSGNDALVAEIKGLREQVQDLRNGQNQQTGAIVGATYDAHERSSATIVQGQQDAAQTADYKERAKVNLA